MVLHSSVVTAMVNLITDPDDPPRDEILHKTVVVESQMFTVESFTFEKRIKLFNSSHVHDWMRRKSGPREITSLLAIT